MKKLPDADQLFESRKTLAYKMATNCARQNSKVILEDLISDCLEALLYAARKFKPVWSDKHQSWCEFGPYAIRAIDWAIKAHLKKLFRQPSLDDVVKLDEDGDDFTLAQSLDDQNARDELQSDLSKTIQPWTAIRSLKTLTKDERKVLTLLYLDGVEPHEVIARYRGNYALVTAHHRQGILKLRAHFKEQGFVVETKWPGRLRYEGEKRGGGAKNRNKMLENMRRARVASIHNRLHRGTVHPKCPLCAENHVF